MKFDQRLKKIEERINPGGGLVIFRASGTEEQREAEFSRQVQEFIKNGGNPDSLFILITDRFGEPLAGAAVKVFR